ncbi:nucleolin-like isoform X1 [Lates japonicus]
MAKTDATRRSKRQSKVVTKEVGEEECSVNTEGQTETVISSEQIVWTEEAAPTESPEMKQEQRDQDEQDSQMDAVIEVKGSTPTVTVSWENKSEGEADDLERRTNPSDQMTDKEMTSSDEQTHAVSSADAIGCTHNAPCESSETEMEQEMEDTKEEQESRKDTATEENGNSPSVTLTWAKKNEEGQNGHIKQETNRSEQTDVKKKAANGKRKALSNTDTSPSKKTKVINDGFCLFVGNLNNSKTFDEVKDSLANYFMTQSVLVQDIRLDHSRKHAHVDLASEMDLTKALTMNGEMILGNPVKIAKAKVRSEDKVKVKVPEADKKAAKNARCLFLKNVPYTATKKDILKIFHKAIDVRFPGGTEGPSQGIAFVEFKNKSIVKKVRQRKQKVKINGRVLIVDSVGETNVPKVTKARANNKDSNTKAPPNNILFVSNLSYNVKEKKLHKVFQKAVNIKMPENKGKSKGYAFVEFATVADAEKALKASQNMKISKRLIRVEFFERRAKPVVKVLLKTLIVKGLAEKTTAETLKSAFEGTVSARVTVDKETGVSKRFGFVEFESEENCKAVKEAMEDCEIDGSKVTVAFAKLKSKKGRQGVRGGLAGRPGGQPAGQGAGRRGQRGRGGNIKGGRVSKGGKGGAAGTPLDAVKEVENKG